MRGHTKSEQMLIVRFQKCLSILVRQVHCTKSVKRYHKESKGRTSKPTPGWRLGAECHASPVEGMDYLAGRRGIHFEHTKAGPVKPTLPEPCPHPLGFNAYAVLHGPKKFQKCGTENRTTIIITMRSQRVGQETYRIPQVHCCGPAEFCTCHTCLAAKGSTVRSWKYGSSKWEGWDLKQ